jgi:adenylosuccinate synthase
MAELQWILEVRCINALLAELKAGEKGEYVIVNIPNCDFLPSELDKLIQACEIVEKINGENRLTYKASSVDGPSGELDDYVEVIDKRDFARISILSSGEIVNIDIPERVLTPSEAHGLLEGLKKVKQTMTKFRA